MSTTIAINSHFERFVRDQVSSGRYGDATEVVSAALSLLEEQQSRLHALRAEITAGLESGPGQDADRVLDRLEDRYKNMADMA